MKVLVTGGTGFIGSHLVDALVGKGYEVRCLVRRTSNVEHLAELGVELVYGDALDKDCLTKVVVDVDVIYHLVGKVNLSVVSRKEYQELREINVTSVERLLEACSLAAVKKFILFSSAAAIGFKKEVIVDEDTPCNPTAPYEIVKYESEQVAREYCSRNEIPLVIMRPTQVYGPGDTKSEILKMCRLIKRHRFVVIGHGKNTIPMVYLDNVVEAAVSAMEKENAAGVFIITGEDRSMNDIVHTIATQMGVKLWGIRVPVLLAEIGVGLIEVASRLFRLTPPFTLKRVASITSDRKYSIAKARHELDYLPSVTLEEGIAKTIQWYQENGWL